MMGFNYGAASSDNSSYSMLGDDYDVDKKRKKGSPLVDNSNPKFIPETQSERIQRLAYLMASHLIQSQVLPNDPSALNNLGSDSEFAAQEPLKNYQINDPIMDFFNSLINKSPSGASVIKKLKYSYNPIYDPQ